LRSIYRVDPFKGFCGRASSPKRRRVMTTLKLTHREIAPIHAALVEHFDRIQHHPDRRGEYEETRDLLQKKLWRPLDRVQHVED
jgi:hypothetical protein